MWQLSSAFRALGVSTLGNYADHFPAEIIERAFQLSYPHVRDTPSHHESSGMELKDLSSNWKKLQLTLKQNNVASNEQLSAGGRERQHDLKRKRAERGPLHSQSTRYPKSKRRKATTRMEDSISRQDAVVPPQPRPTIRSVAPSGSSSFAADRVNEGLSHTYVANKYQQFFSTAC
jgi:hypothetical protein